MVTLPFKNPTRKDPGVVPGDLISRASPASVCARAAFGVFEVVISCMPVLWDNPGAFLVLSMDNKGSIELIRSSSLGQTIQGTQLHRPDGTAP